MRSSKHLQKNGQKSKNNGSPKKYSAVAKSSKNNRTPIRSLSRKGLRNNDGLYSTKITEFFSPSEKYSSDRSDKKSSSESDMDIPNYQEILNEKKNCDKYMYEVQQLAQMVVPLTGETSSESESIDNIPKKLFQSTRYNIHSRINAQPASPENVCEEANPKNFKIPLLPSRQERPRNTLKCQKSVKLKSNMESFPKNKENLIDTRANIESKVVSSTGNTRRKLNFEIKHGENKNRAKGTEDAKPKKFERKSSGSYDKYGICMPSHQDMLSQKQYCNDYSDVVQNLMDLVVPLPQVQIKPLTNPTCGVKALNCKGITREELIAAYKSNINYIEDIIEGKISNKRHEKFKRVATREELTFNTSMIAFTNEQKQTLVKKLCKRFGDSSLHSDYYFKVLLPELCLKIFMDVYSMSREEATEYLECYPVEV